MAKSGLPKLIVFGDPKKGHVSGVITEFIGLVKGKAETKKSEAELKTAQIVENIMNTIGTRNGRRSTTEPAAANKGSDADRLDRLAYGRDVKGNAATDEDRAWIAKQGN